MAMTWRCACGQMQGEIDPGRAYVRGTCHCRDCQAFARFLGRPGLMDANGGSDIVPMAPSGFRILRGDAQLACMSLGPKGLLRWYASCCRTPLANTGRTPSPPYVGVPVLILDAPGDKVDAAFGPRDATMIHAASATHPVKPTPLRFLIGGLKIMAGVLREKLAGRARSTSFFDPLGQPVRSPEVLTLAERERFSRPG